jgi:hypothetical protein
MAGQAHTVKPKTHAPLLGEFFTNADRAHDAGSTTADQAV